MLTLVLPLAVAIVVAMLLSRSLTAWAREPIRWWPLIVLALGIDLVLARVPVTQVPWLVDNGHWVWLGTLLVMAAMLARNTLARRGWRRAPWLVALLGTVLNVVVILANGGYMPVDSAALGSSGASADLASRDRYRRDISISDSTHLTWLSDVIVGPAWLPRGGVISIGDVLLVSGLSWWIIQTSLMPGAVTVYTRTRVRAQSAPLG